MLLPLTDYTHNNVNLFSSPGIIAISGIVHLAAKPFMAIDAKAMHKILGLSRNICLGIFALIYAYLCLDIFKKRKVLNADMLLKSLLAATLAFFILAINWLMPWYFPQMIILAIIIFSITKKQNCLILIQGATLYAVLYYVLLR